MFHQGLAETEGKLHLRAVEPRFKEVRRDAENSFVISTSFNEVWGKQAKCSLYRSIVNDQFPTPNILYEIFVSV